MPTRGYGKKCVVYADHGDYGARCENEARPRRYLNGQNEDGTYTKTCVLDVALCDDHAHELFVRWTTGEKREAEEHERREAFKALMWERYNRYPGVRFEGDRFQKWVVPCVRCGHRANRHRKGHETCLGVGAERCECRGWTASLEDL